MSRTIVQRAEKNRRHLSAPFLKCVVLPAVVFISCRAAGIPDEPIPIEHSVVKIVNQYNRFNWYAPWDSGSTGKGTGSGFVISKNRIMTNAHVVSDSAILLVYFFNDPKPYSARVVAIGHDCDLAILEVEDTARISQIPPLDFSGLPALRSRVITYGYPVGGQLISSTIGVVSRIEPQLYTHAGTDFFLAGQTDAAINPGNSGGPVIQDDKVVGVAFQGSRELENTGFFIPFPIIDHFLTDLADGTYNGFPYFGALGVTLENPAARAYAKMRPDETGIRVDYIFKGASAEKKLQCNDVITSICGYAIANDGTIEWNGLRINCMILVDGKQMGQILPVQIIRNGERLSADIELTYYNPSAAKGNLFDRRPSYFIYAGLVFVPLNRETLKTYAEKWMVDAPQELIYEMYYRHMIDHDFPDTPEIIQIRRLDHEVNVEEGNYLYRIVDSVNGIAVHTLPEIIDAFKSNQGKEHVIRYRYGNRMTVLDREKADAAHPEILQRYGVPRDRFL
jgi:S1-C subfamily serine protease